MNEIVTKKDLDDDLARRITGLINDYKMGLEYLIK